MVGMNTAPKPKVLQVYALTGLGHLREATSVKNALDKAGIENDTLDILKWARMHSWYTRIAVAPLLVFKWFFEVTTRNSSSFNSFQPPVFALKAFLALMRIFEVPLGFPLRRYLHNSDYNIFLAVHPWGLGALWSFGLGKRICQKLINIIPDEIDIGSASFYGIPGGKHGPLHLVNSQRVQSLFERVGVHPDRIKVIGHTLDPVIFDNREKIFRRVQKHLGDRNHPLTLGLYIGGTGTNDEIERIIKIVKNLSGYVHIGEYRLKAIPGPHLEFADQLSDLRDELGLTDPDKFEIFSSANRDKVIEVGHRWFAEEIDVLFAKTGEIIFYSMGTGIPHIHFPPKGANEVEHVEVMKIENAIHEFDRIIDLHTFLQQRDYLKELSSNAFNSNYKLGGAQLVAEEVIRLHHESKRTLMPPVFKKQRSV
ncbi:MAG: hypothetical protein TR69_WS6001001487 [candidate division WS6 bacterium OLB20]|uniref:Processive diacylglycerol beta-glucosyltransferase n=1 Tax=candidate division WS6 bacterium OLB20 TaxID=1617426 RepID=A0A136LW48_9BACT|nr:MAG: hypothetical protein TR69_WS6001001487 [candidate division WS6 bacterium OLB20]